MEIQFNLDLAATGLNKIIHELQSRVDDAQRDGQNVEYHLGLVRDLQAVHGLLGMVSSELDDILDDYDG